jgi:hypothetical protein
LRHRPFGRVHQQERAVDHRQDPLHLAAEIGVARRVDDVEALVLPIHRRAFGQDGDAAFALQVAGIHGAFCHCLMCLDGARLAQHLVNECRFTMIDMGDDGEIS